MQPQLVAIDPASTKARRVTASGSASCWRGDPRSPRWSHVHSPYLGAWSQTHRDLPIRYVPVQRWTLGHGHPDLHRPHPDADRLHPRAARGRPAHAAILEANGGATVWGRAGCSATAEHILILEEGAKFQILAQALGGSQEYGAGVLEQQWEMSGLTDEARKLGLLP